MNKPILKVAAKGLIVNSEGEVLILREADTYAEGSQIGKYGLCGGRLDIGESYDNGLTREVFEETGLEVEPMYPIYVGEWRPNIKGVPHQIIAIFTVCKAKTTDVKLSDEHDHYEWIKPSEAKNFNFMPPDDEVITRFAEWTSKGVPKT